MSGMSGWEENRWSDDYSPRRTRRPTTITRILLSDRTTV